MYREYYFRKQNMQNTTRCLERLELQDRRSTLSSADYPMITNIYVLPAVRFSFLLTKLLLQLFYNVFIFSFVELFNGLWCDTK